LIHRSKGTLSSIKKIVQSSREKFSDQESGELFNRIVLKDIEKVDFVLSGLLNYIRATTPIRKTNTVHTLIDEVLRKNRVQLEEKKVELSKQFEKDLPETIVPDEHLRYVLDSVLQYALSSMPSQGRIRLLTRSFSLRREETEDQWLPDRYGWFIEIQLSFTHAFQKDEGRNLILRLAKGIVVKNQGMMKVETDEKKSEIVISLGFPVERRKVVYYRAANE